MDSRTIKACRAWVALFNSGMTIDVEAFRASVKAFENLVDVAEGFQNICNNDVAYIKALEKDTEDKASIIKSLRADILGMENEMDNLRSRLSRW